MTDILEESNVSLSHENHSDHRNHGGDHHELHDHSELDAVFGVVLYHALKGDCMTSQELPEEVFFLDFIFRQFGSDNATLLGRMPVLVHTEPPQTVY